MAYQLAEINIAKFIKPMDDPVNIDFVNALDQVNAAAEAQQGFVWRLVGDGGNAMDIQAFDDPDLIINMSVWQDVSYLMDFVYKNADHKAVLLRRKEWFENIQFHMALWWVEEGRKPTLNEAKLRLQLLEELGPSPSAFTFKHTFPAPADI